MSVQFSDSQFSDRSCDFKGLSRSEIAEKLACAVIRRYWPARHEEYFRRIVRDNVRVLRVYREGGK